MKKIGKWYIINNMVTICPNYGGWVIVGTYDWNIYKTYKDALNSYKKRKDSTNKAEPCIIGKMTRDQFIDALCDND